MTPSRLSLVAAAVLSAAVVGASPAAAADPSNACGPDADLISFSDALDKTTFDGTAVGGLSALVHPSLSGGRGRGRGLVDNQGTTPARIYDLALGSRPRVTGITRLTRPDGTAYTGADLDGEGLVALPDGSILVSSETEPSIRRFDRSGRQTGELEVPASFRVAPAGEATANQTFEGLAATPAGWTVWAGMEGPLAADGTTAEGGSRVRLVRYGSTRPT